MPYVTLAPPSTSRVEHANELMVTLCNASKPGRSSHVLEAPSTSVSAVDRLT